MTNAATKNGSNGVHPDAAITPEHDLLWDSLSPKVMTELEKPLDPSLVSQRKGRAGRTYQYIEGHTVIDQANRIFGFAGWGYEVVGDVTLREIEQVDPKTGEMSRIRAYSAPVRVTVPGAPPRTDIGFHAVADETAEGHDTACKGSVTDGLKRALRSFGDQFGNCLYGDQAATGQPAKQDSAADSLAPSLRATLIELGAMQGFDEKQVRAAVKGNTMRQASRRSWRIGQTRPVKVVFMAYRGTLQADALKLVAQKLQSSLAVEGELPEDGLAAYGDDGDDIMLALARKIVNGEEEEEGESVEEAFAQARDAEAVSEELLVDEEWHAVEVEAEPELVVVGADRNGTTPAEETPWGNGHDEAIETQRSLFSWAEFMAEEPPKPSRKNGKPKPATMSMFEWALSMEEEKEAQTVS